MLFSLEIDRVFPTTYLFYESEKHVSVDNVTTFNEDLNVFILDGKDLVKSAQVLHSIYGQRTRSNKETWLVDITPGDTIENTQHLLQNLKLDLDDDMVWFSSSDPEGTVKLWDVYRIVDGFNVSVLPLGHWLEDIGLKYIQPEKWIRRRNLMVCIFRGIT